MYLTAPLHFHPENTPESGGPRARFSILGPYIAIFSSSVSKNGEVYAPETFCMKRTSVHIRNEGIKQLCNHKVPNFFGAFRPL